MYLCRLPSGWRTRGSNRPHPSGGGGGGRWRKGRGNGSSTPNSGSRVDAASNCRNCSSRSECFSEKCSTVFCFEHPRSFWSKRASTSQLSERRILTRSASRFSDLFYALESTLSNQGRRRNHRRVTQILPPFTGFLIVVRDCHCASDGGACRESGTHCDHCKGDWA